MRRDKSRELFDRAQEVIPGGVNSPVRAFRSVEGEPLFIRNASGSRIFDEDGNEYIDFVSSWGPLILGHAHPRVVAAIASVLERGTSYGAPTALEVEMAERIVKAYPSIHKVRMTSSGTEAAMSAIRLARGYTGRHKIIKFDGCYHGHSDGLLVKAGSGGMTFGTPDSAGVPPDYARNTLNLPFNDLESVRETVRGNPGQVACVILEPVAGNMGVIPPAPGFLEGLREISREEGIVLIFDEVITGFRIALGGAQERYGVVPDMTCLGKIIGGGLPVGAFGGKKEIMACLSPEGPVYQAGTLSGNPVAMSAGNAALQALEEPGVYETLEEKSAFLARELEKAARDAGVPACFHRVGSMMSCFFTDQEVKDYTSARTCETKRFARFHREMLARGVYLAPSQFEAAFVSLAHSQEDLERTIKAAREAFSAVAG
ncbi:MAG: glutamate-1-semialdehyde 2,1-aminomutase [Deltaproteobacteria bacterium]|nr:glutamate-1-semialdehyde 2,1-aminomutase [Deltaproteobacteria bacterium]